MFERHSAIFVVAVAMGWLGVAPAAPVVCAEDLDGDGDIASLGETANCLLSVSDAALCPINAVNCVSDVVETCPVPGIPCQNGVCQTPGSCQILRGGGVLRYYCPRNPGIASSDDLAACNAACQSATQSCSSQASSYRCPLSDQYACISIAGRYQCSANACIDLAAVPPVETDLPGTMLVDDGARDTDGQCLGATVIFNGRGMACLPSGIRTAFQNCCDFEGEIYTDSTGSTLESGLTNTAIIATFQAAGAAYAAFDAAVAAGSTSAAASQAAAEAATDIFAGAIDPTTLVIAAAISLILDWLASACPQQSMETAALMASGYCVELGSYCKTRWLGGCVQRARAQCCFNSKLARIIHEQGRAQLKAFAQGFGTPEAPDCRGFAPEEFQALDFSKIDLSEYFDEVTRASDALIQRSLEEGLERFNATHGTGN